MRLGFDRKTTLAIAIFAVLLLLYFNFSQWYLHTQMKGFLEERVTRGIMSSTQSTAERLDPFIVEEVASGDYLPDDYDDLVHVLDDAKHANDLLGVNLLDTDGRNLLISPDDTAGTNEEILNLAEFTLAAAGIPASTPIYRSDSLYLLSAFAPVTDFNDSVIAVLHAEAGYAVFETIEHFKRNIVFMNIVSVLFMLLFVTLFYLVNRRLLLAQQTLLHASAISSMGEMAATIAHEIRNPLGIIRNSAERIKNKYAEDVDDPAFSFITDEVDRLNAVVAGYLDFAHPAKGKMENFSLKKLIETLVDQTRTDFMDAGIEVSVTTEHDDDSYSIRADRFAIRQAILNLMLNAKDAQPDGGRLDISIRPEKQGSKDGVKIDIVDDGVGIKPKILNRVFDPFFTTREKGSGLGLYVAKNVIDAHGGRLTLRPNSGGGTVATLFLPREG